LNALLAFQWFINDIFANILDICIVIHLDDILIYLNNLQEHKNHIKEVLHGLKANKLYISLEKFFFHQEWVEFLGYVLSPEDLQINNKKIKVIQDWLIPKYIKEIQVFLDFVNFYRKFIYNYLDLTVSLTHLTWKNALWN